MNTEQMSENDKKKMLAYCWHRHLAAARAGATELADYWKSRYFQLTNWNDVGFRRFEISSAERRG